MFVAFEGIDGSGKTTLSNLVCERLRATGVAVVHARDGGVLRTGVARRVREVTRDPSLLEMSPRAEMFLHLARESQQLDEIVRPALARGVLCVADRSVHSIVALAVAGRGLPRPDVGAAVRVAAGGLSPDLVVLVDVDADLAALRKKIGKILDRRDREPGSRKGLSGTALHVRVRLHLLAEAAADPGRWLVVENEGRTLEELAHAIADEIVRRRAPAALRARREIARAAAARPASPHATPEGIAARFREAVLAIAPGEPALAAELLAGIPGSWAHEIRSGLAARTPRMVARSLRGLGDPDSLALRRTLAAVAPRDVAAALLGDAGADAAALRAELVDLAPDEVAWSLAGDGSVAAWALRDRALDRGALGAVLEGLAGVDATRAWQLRSKGMRRGLWHAVGRSLAALRGTRADALRASLAERDRVAALHACDGADGHLARELRERLFALAPKRVLRSLAGVDAPYAWELRGRALAAAPEALDSVEGMDEPRAWALREAGVEAWPARALASVAGLGRSERTVSLVARALAAAPGRLVVLRNAHAALACAAARGAIRARAAPAGSAAAQAREEEARPCTT